MRDYGGGAGSVMKMEAITILGNDWTMGRMWGMDSVVEMKTEVITVLNVVWIMGRM